MAAAAATRPLTVLAFDFGRRRIGVAVGECAAGGLARGLVTLTVNDGAPPWDRITALVDEWRPQRLVVGVARNMDDSDSPMTAACHAFGTELRRRCGLEVDFVDERLTSRAALDTLRDARASGRRRRRVRSGDVDREAARLIAHQWLAEQADRDTAQEHT